MAIGDHMEDNQVAEAIHRLADVFSNVLKSPNVPDANLELANIVDVVSRLVSSIYDSFCCAKQSPVDINIVDALDKIGFGLYAIADAIKEGREK